MPRQPLGEKPMTDAERQRKRRERLRQERGPVDPSPAAIIDALRKENARLRRQRPTKAEPTAKPSGDLAEARAEIARLKHEIDKLQWGHRALQAELADAKQKAAKPPKPQLDPDSEAAQIIERLRKANKTLRQDKERLAERLRTLVPPATRRKVAKALTEMTTSKAIRFDALQEWNGLGTNTVG